MLRIMLTAVLLTMCLLAVAKETTEPASAQAASHFANMSDEGLVRAFLPPRTDTKNNHPSTGLPMDMAALDELFQRQRDRHWQQVMS
jgi:hypothetical protein